MKLESLLGLVAVTGCLAGADTDIGETQLAVTGVLPRAYRLGPHASLNTDIAFSTFVNAPFTIGAWVMPETAYGSFGPVFADSGGGSFAVGYGDYRSGDWIDIGSIGQPVLMIEVGNVRKLYLAPGYTKRAWHYLAVERTPVDPASGTYKFLLFLDGTQLAPKMEIADGSVVPDIDPTFTGALPNAPTGTLRLGRVASDGSVAAIAWQWYGLVDDVTVFSKALSGYEMLVIMTNGVSASTSGFLAGTTFDHYDLLSWGALDPRFQHFTTASGADDVAVQSPRAGADGQLFDDPALLARGMSAHYRLPFKRGEVWHINFGFDDRAGSHNGFADWCWDIGRVTPAAPNPTYVASANLSVAQVHNEPWVMGNEPSFLRLAGGPEEFIVYNHLVEDSFLWMFLSQHPGWSAPDYASPGTWLPIKYGEPLAVGGVNANHIHIGMDNGLDAFASFATLPMAFYDYEVSDDNVSWRWVRLGRPTAGQYVRVNLRGVPGDVNDDGKADMIATGGSGWTTAMPVAFSTGTGAMNVTNVPGLYDFNTFSRQTGARVLSGDFDADGKTDVLATGVSWWQSTPVASSEGDGTFTVTNWSNPGGSAQNFNLISRQAGSKVLTGDVDGDGRTDILATGVSWWQTTPVAFSRGDGTFNVVNNASAANFNAYSSQAGVQVVSGDFDGDGRADLLATGGSNWGTTPVARSLGDGTFWVTNATNPGGSSENFNQYSQVLGATVLAGDWNGDGRTDLAAVGVSTWTHLPVALALVGGTTFDVSNPSSSFAVDVGATNPRRLLVGDYNGDGYDDIAMVSEAFGQNRIALAISNGNGTFTAISNPTNGGNFSSFAYSAAAVVSSWR